MKPDEIRSVVLECLNGIAPEADPATIQPTVNLRDQLDLDSVDLLNFMISLHKRFKIEVPEKDYPQLMTLNGCVTYLSSRVTAGAGTTS
jgi:acyl carrier protein